MTIRLMCAVVALWLLQVSSGGVLTGVNTAVTITSPTSATTYDAGTASTVTLSGTATSDRVVTGCTWTNSAGGSGAATGTTTWSIASVSLTTGSNVITVTCVNTAGVAGTDVVTVTMTASGTDSTSYCAVGCFYVRPDGGAYGTENGTSWTNAFDGFADLTATIGSVACGSTIWVAGGTYTQNLVVTKTCTTGARMSIRRARSDTTAVTGAAGYSSSFDATVVMSNADISLQDADWWTVDGRTTFTSGTWGWKLNNPGFTGEDYSMTFPNTNNATVAYVWIQGPGFVSYTGDSRGISLSAAGTASNLTFDHVKIAGHTTGIFINGVDSVTFDHLDESDCSAVNSASWHPNGIWAAGATNLTVRYSYFHQGPEGHGTGEGIFAEQSGGNTNWKIYGNIFAHLNTTGWKAVELTSAVSGLLFYNNTCHDIIVPCLYQNGGSCTGTSFVKNNLTVNGSLDGCGTAANNLDVASTAVFVDAASADYHIVSTTGASFPRDAGANLGSPYDTDRDGSTRGADGTWDIGAYEFR